MYLISLGILADRCGSVVVMERDCDTKGPSLTLGCDLLSCKWKQSQLVSITSQNFVDYLKYGSNRLRKGNLRRLVGIKPNWVFSMSGCLDNHWLVTINDPRNKASSSRARSPSRHLAFRLLEMRFLNVWPPHNNKLGIADLTVRWKFETFLTNDFSFYW